MIASVRKILGGSSFLQGVTSLTMGTVLAQGLLALSLPLLTRLYSPEDFGLLAIYVSIVSILCVVSTLRLDIAIPLPEQDGDAINILVLTLAISVALAACLSLLALMIPESLIRLLQQPAMAPFLWMVPLGVLAASTYSALQYWSTRQRRFSLISRTRITRAAGSSATQLALGAMTYGPFGLLFGHMLYGGLGSAALARSLWTNDRALLGNVSRARVQEMLRRYRKFPTHATPAALLDASYQYLPFIIMGPVIGIVEIGKVFLVFRVMALPASLVGASISQVFLATSRDRIAQGALGALTRRVMRNALLIGAPTILGLGFILFFAGDFIFGEAYASAGQIALLMVPWFVMQLVASPVSTIFASTDRQTAWLALQLFGFITIVGGTYGATLLFPGQTVAIFSLLNFSFYAVSCIVIFKLSYKIDRVT